MDYEAVCTKYKRAIDAEIDMAKSRDAKDKASEPRTVRLANVKAAIKGLNRAAPEFEVLQCREYAIVAARLEVLNQMLTGAIKDRRWYITPRDSMVWLLIAILDRELGRQAKFYHDAMADEPSEDTKHLQQLILEVGYPSGASNTRTVLRWAQDVIGRAKSNRDHPALCLLEQDNS